MAYRKKYLDKFDKTETHPQFLQYKDEVGGSTGQRNKPQSLALRTGHFSKSSLVKVAIAKSMFQMGRDIDVKCLRSILNHKPQGFHGNTKYYRILTEAHFEALAENGQHY